ncbi:hypothetical protein AAFF_G00402910 [Aldrovandia affinis]|uniref:Uncharacterized protein n=1 Tax=Aldrovandia affinis TaxID=143900 RepID=A0AAD7T788_9TELE|nr:hypothetical protein AAFF_G00402910 [Aldrovandia affinis]
MLLQDGPRHSARLHPPGHQHQGVVFQEEVSAGCLGRRRLEGRWLGEVLNEKELHREKHSGEVIAAENERAYGLVQVAKDMVEVKDNVDILKQSTS